MQAQLGVPRQQVLGRADGLTERRGVTPAAAKNLLRSRPTLIASLMVERGEADAMICGLVGRFHKKLGYLRSVFDFDKGVTGTAAAMGTAARTGSGAGSGTWSPSSAGSSISAAASRPCSCSWS